MILSVNPENTLDFIKIRYAHEAAGGGDLSCGRALDFAAIQKHEIMADLGSGRGRDILQASAYCKFAYGIDFTEEMTGTAEANAARLQVSNVKFLHGDINNIPLHDNSIDVVISNCTINHAPDKQRIFSEIHRILKAGGRYIISDIIAESEIPGEIANDPAAIAQCYGGAIIIERYFKAIYNSGFNNVEILEESKPYDKRGVWVRSITIRSYKDENKPGF